MGGFPIDLHWVHLHMTAFGWENNKLGQSLWAKLICIPADNIGVNKLSSWLVISEIEFVCVMEVDPKNAEGTWSLHIASNRFQKVGYIITSKRLLNMQITVISVSLF